MSAPFNNEIHTEHVIHTVVALYKHTSEEEGGGERGAKITFSKSQNKFQIAFIISVLEKCFQLFSFPFLRFHFFHVCDKSRELKIYTGMFLMKTYRYHYIAKY